MWGYLAKAGELAEKAKAAASEAASKAAEQAAITAEEVKKAAQKASEQAQASDYYLQAKEAAQKAQSSDVFLQAKAAAADAASAATSAADSLSKRAEQAQADLLEALGEKDSHIIRVRPELIVIEFPSEDKINRISEQLNAEFPQRMLIFNMSERRYDTSCFQAEVVDVAFKGLPAPPLALLMELCLSAQQWLSTDPQNVLVVHCYLGFSRSAIFSSCFMAFRGLCKQPVDALQDVCEHLGLDDTQAVLPSQRRYLDYFQQCQQGFSPPPLQLKFARVTLNGVPKLEPEGSIACRPYLEVWCLGALVYSSLPAAPAESDDAEPVLPAIVKDGDPCVSFIVPEDVIISADVLLRIRHVRDDGSKETACRLAFHTGFVPDGLRLAKHELDGACDDERFPEDSVLDIAFHVVDGSTDAALPVFEKARTLSKRLCEEEHRRSEEERRRQEREQERLRLKAGIDLKDEFEDLEKTLLRAGDGYPQRAGSRDARRTGTAVAGPDDAEALKRALSDALADEGSEAAGKKAAKAKESNNDIDDLFSEFDAALASVGSGSEKATAEKATAEKAAADKASAEEAAEKKAVAEKATADKVAVEKAALEKATADKAEAEKAAAEKVAADKAAVEEKAALEKATADKAEAEKAAAEAEQVAAEKAAAETAAAEEGVAKKAAADKAAAERAEEEKAADEQALANVAAVAKVAADKAAAEKAEEEKAAAEKALAETAAAEKVAAEKAAAEEAAADRAAAEKAEAEKAEAEKAIAAQAAADKEAEEKAAADKAVADKAAADKAAAEKATMDDAAADKVAADKALADKAAEEKVVAEKAAADKAAADKAVAEKAAAKAKAAAAPPADDIFAGMDDFLAELEG